MSGFTSGPWEVGGDGVDGLWIEPPQKSENVICDVVSRVAGEGGGWTDEDLANAHLIAASPDLHLALRGALKPLSPHATTAETRDWLAAYERWYEGSRATALAKARGDGA